jgi:hypothetical protein
MANSNGWGDGSANNAIGWGQGANNATGWGSSHATSNSGLTNIVGGVALDADASAFITAAAITDATQQSAINTLVTGLKTDGIWTKMKAIYPFVGGTATTHKYNLKDPRDLDAAFRLTFSGGWTHSVTGATPNGVNAYANTFLNPTTSLSVNSHSFGIYSKTNNTTGARVYGVLSTPSIYMQNDLNTGNFASGTVGTIISYTASPTTGLLLSTRTAANLYKAFRNNTLLGTNTFNNTSISNGIFYLATRNDFGLASSNFMNHQHAFAFLSDGLTDAEASNLYTKVQAYQTTLSRQV